jgi:hypothetical protein
LGLRKIAYVVHELSVAVGASWAEIRCTDTANMNNDKMTVVKRRERSQ